MKSFIYTCLIISSIVMFGCKKSSNDDAPTPTPTINGTWKYDKNIQSGCNDIVGSVVEIKDGKATATSTPTNNIYKWVVGDVFFYNATQTTSPNNFSAIGSSHSSGGTVADPNIKLKITVSTDVKSMTLDYGSTVCNPVQLWTKTN